MRIYFPRLAKLSPTIISSVIKLSEEIGELSREITRKPQSREGILSELLDVAQVCATMMFLAEGEDVREAVKAHVWKLYGKGYLRKVPTDVGVRDCNGDKVFVLPPLDIQPTLEETFFKLSEEAGELAQGVGKRRNMSGEKNVPTDYGLVGDLLDVMQTCVTMLYIFVDEWGIDVDALLATHKAKLKEHRYL